MHYRKTVNIVITLFVFLLSLKTFSQYQKEVIYFNYNASIEGCEYDFLTTKSKEKKGINFNLCGKAVLFYNYNQGNDTLPINRLKDFLVITTEEAKQKVKAFREETRNKLPPKDTDKLYQAYDRNDLFETYVIEIINKEQIVVYPVKWRNERVIP